MKFVRTISALSLLVILTEHAFVQTVRPAKILLVETGSFHGDEVKARSGEKWLGLYVTKQGSSLIESTVTVRRVLDEVVDEDPLNPTGKEVSVARRTQPVFLVKNAKALKPGPVSTIYRGDQTSDHALNYGTQIKLKLNEQNYQLNVVSKHPRSKECPDCLPMDTGLMLKCGASTQVLYDLGKHTKNEWGEELDLPEKIADVGGWFLLWAGDIDGDGKLDLYLGLSPQSNVEERRLFLSSQAKTGQLVREIAAFRIVGC